MCFLSPLAEQAWWTTLPSPSRSWPNTRSYSKPMTTWNSPRNMRWGGQSVKLFFLLSASWYRFLHDCVLIGRSLCCSALGSRHLPLCVIGLLKLQVVLLESAIMSIKVISNSAHNWMGALLIIWDNKRCKRKWMHEFWSWDFCSHGGHFEGSWLMLST